jgi:hypothetical protein
MMIFFAASYILVQKAIRKPLTSYFGVVTDNVLMIQSEKVPTKLNLARIYYACKISGFCCLSQIF